jgi:HlyD family secretion protein
MTAQTSANLSIKRNLLAGIAVALLLGVGLGGWAATAELAGAVIASGQMVVESNVKKVQHPLGGIVGELFVQEGQHVKGGDVLLRLDETQAKASLAIVLGAIDELNARESRLEAERDGAEKVTFPYTLVARSGVREVKRILDGETRLFRLRYLSREGERGQLKERIAQLENEISGLEQQANAKDREIVLINKELEGVRELWMKNLVQVNRLTLLERDAARIEGERGQLVAATAQAKGKIAELELQILQIDQNLRSEVGAELAEVRAKLSEHHQRKVAAEDQLKRIEIRAPQTGAVHQLAVHTLGGVIAPGDVIMLIVPDADRLIVEAKVSPNDIDQLQLNQQAQLRLSAFSQRETPVLSGLISRISADLSADERTGASFYVVRISLSEDQIKRLKGLTLVPGMPVEVFVQTGKRSVMSYLVKPLGDHLARALREG